MSNSYIAVYGSLKQGFHNHNLLHDSEYLGTYTTSPEFTMVDLGYFPGITEAGCTPIHVEIYRVTGETLEKIDILEGVPSFYMRQQMTIPGFGVAYLYVLSKDYQETLVIHPNMILNSGSWT